VTKIHYEVIHGLDIFFYKKIKSFSMKELPMSFDANTLKHFPKKLDEKIAFIAYKLFNE